ncbi:hypothetical protein [Snodgrassella communis]|uniref:hypothetical protein n=1 Tax=Snodgrassella communis TaxID=2946699 RepID=UPI00286C410B|nr:hypothetical protein [Snodgrassella communis]WMY91014.1 hypothetical protein PYG29_06040 [Snodgrassella communis]
MENNALINSNGESKLNAQERKINEKLKKAGVQNADDYQRKYDACKTDACRQQVKKDYIEATEQASKIILDLYRSGQLSTEESMILLTSYASKMMQGAGESQDGLSTPIFNMDAQRWTLSGVIANPDFQQITLSNLVQKMKQSGSSEQQIAMQVLRYQIAGQAIGSYSMVEQVDALYHSGVSLNTVINAIALKRGKALSAKEIQSITSRYNNNAGSLVTANGQVIKNNGHQSTASESRGARQGGGKGKVEGAHKTEQRAGRGTIGWKGDPVDVIKMPDGKFTSMDNTRIAAAREAGIDIKANVRNFDDKLSPTEVNRFSDPRKGFVPTTWGEAITGRINKQSGGFSKNNPYGSSTPPRINGKPKG